MKWTHIIQQFIRLNNFKTGCVFWEFLAALKRSIIYDFVLYGYCSHKLDTQNTHGTEKQKILSSKLWPWQRVKVGHKEACLMVPYENIKCQ